MRKAVTSVLFIFAVALASQVAWPKLSTRVITHSTCRASPDPPVQEASHASLAIREFRAPGYLRQGAIVYRESPEQWAFTTIIVGRWIRASS